MITKFVPTALLALLVVTGCGPTLTVLHQDPSVGPVDVRVDDDSVGTIEYGEAVRVSLQPGYHRVQASPSGQGSDPWSEDGEGWYFYFDREAQLTLLGHPPLQ